MGANNNSKKKRNKKAKNRYFTNRSLPTPKPSMEDFMVDAKDHKVLKKFCKKLENRFKVKISMPKTKSLASDVVFVSVEGEEVNRNYVKKFLDSQKTRSKDNSSVDLIMLSDSESEAGSEDISIIDLSFEDAINSEQSIVSKVSQDVSVCEINTSASSSNVQIMNNASSMQPKGKKRKAENMKVRKKANLSESVLIISEEPGASSNPEVDFTKETNLSESVLIINEEPSTSSNPAVDFIPLTSGSKSINQKDETNKSSCSNSKNSSEMNNDDIIIIDEPQSTLVTRRLRPIVIDGSNVAFTHGKPFQSFSVKGIKLAIDYFLNRGHTQVTAFVPKFRRNRNPNRTFPTTDVDIFDELEKRQQVVFTPSRRINGKNVTSYDDRFIVELAASNGGVIVSNDNYRDLVDDSESFKEAIEQRLLMFVFVGDSFMVPKDPLGRNGPVLDDYLSFPQEDK